MLSESQNIEYKETWRDEYLKWICGFANAQGGRIYIGVNDNKEIIGLSESKKLMEDIPNKIVNYLGIVADVNLLIENDKEYIEIVVSPSNMPIAYKGTYHYRSGSTKQELKGTALQQFIMEKMGHSWDDIPVYGATIDDIDRSAIDFFLRRSIKAGRTNEQEADASTEDVLRNLGLYTKNGELKNAAILLFGKHVEQFFPAAKFKIGRFHTDESDLITQDLIEGNIITMANRVGVNEGVNVGNMSETKLSERQKFIITAIRSNPYVTGKQMSETLAVTQRSVERDLAVMQKAGIIRHEGRNKAGIWVVLDKK